MSTSCHFAGISLLILLLAGFIGCSSHPSTPGPSPENTAAQAEQTVPETQVPSTTETAPPAQPEVLPVPAAEPEQIQQNDEPSAPTIPTAENDSDSNVNDSAAVQKDAQDDNNSIRQTPTIIGMDSLEFTEFYCEATLKYLENKTFVAKRKIYKNIKNDAVNKLLNKGCVKFCEAAAEQQNCMNDCLEKASFESSIDCLPASPKPRKPKII